MANDSMTPEQVRSTSKALEVSPSCYDTSSKVYGQRKMPSGGRSSEGGMVESGFRVPNSPAKKKMKKTVKMKMGGMY